MELPRSGFNQINLPARSFNFESASASCSRFACVPSVTQDDDYGTLIDTAQPLSIEIDETRADPRASRPAVNVCRQTIECAMVSLVLQVRPLSVTSEVAKTNDSTFAKLF